MSDDTKGSSFNKLDHTAVSDVLREILAIFKKNKSVVCSKCIKYDKLRHPTCNLACYDKLVNKIEDNLYKKYNIKLGQIIEKINMRLFGRTQKKDTTFVIASTIHIMTNSVENAPDDAVLAYDIEVDNSVKGVTIFRKISDGEIVFDSRSPPKQYKIYGHHVVFNKECKKMYYCNEIQAYNGIMGTQRKKYENGNNELYIDFTETYKEITRDNILLFVADICDEMNEIIQSAAIKTNSKEREFWLGCKIR